MAKKGHFWNREDFTQFETNGLKENTKKFINVLFGILGIGMLGIGGYVYHVVADYEVKIKNQPYA